MSSCRRSSAVSSLALVGRGLANPELAGHGADRRQVVKLAIFGAKIPEIGLGAHRAACRLHHEFTRLEFAPMLVEVLAQPAVKRSKFPCCDLGRDFRTRFEGGGIELRAENIAYGVALKSAPDGARIPMN